jgi:type VI secretion system protein ImpJ
MDDRTQQLDRRLSDQLRRAARWSQPYPWDLRALDIDRDALAGRRFVVRRLQARMRDGTPVEVPEDCVLPPLDLHDAFKSDPHCPISLALPVAHPETADALSLSAGESEFAPASACLRDLKLLPSGQGTAGYEVLPLVRWAIFALPGFRCVRAAATVQ